MQSVFHRPGEMFFPFRKLRKYRKFAKVLSTFLVISWWIQKKNKEIWHWIWCCQDDKINSVGHHFIQSTETFLRDLGRWSRVVVWIFLYCGAYSSWKILGWWLYLFVYSFSVNVRFFFLSFYIKKKKKDSKIPVSLLLCCSQHCFRNII